MKCCVCPRMRIQCQNLSLNGAWRDLTTISFLTSLNPFRSRPCSSGGRSTSSDPCSDPSRGGSVRCSFEGGSENPRKCWLQGNLSAYFYSTTFSCRKLPLRGWWEQKREIQQLQLSKSLWLGCLLRKVLAKFCLGSHWFGSLRFWQCWTRDLIPSGFEPGFWESEAPMICSGWGQRMTR